MLCARGQRLLMMDADGATKVSDLERLEAKLAEISSELRACMHACIDQCSGEDPIKCQLACIVCRMIKITGRHFSISIQVLW